MKYLLCLTILLPLTSFAESPDFQCTGYLWETIPIVKNQLKYPEDTTIDFSRDIPEQYVLDEYVYNKHLLNRNFYRQSYRSAFQPSPGDGNLIGGVLYFTEIGKKLFSFSFGALEEGEGPILLNVDGENTYVILSEVKSLDQSARYRSNQLQLEAYQSSNMEISFTAMLRSVSNYAKGLSVYNFNDNYILFYITTLREIDVYDSFTFLSETSIGIECSKNSISEVSD